MRSDHCVITGPEDTVAIVVECVDCGEPSELVVDTAAYLRWRRGELVQVAFPGIPPEKRELLVSGKCDKCWTGMFGPRSDAGTAPSASLAEPVADNQESCF